MFAHFSVALVFKDRKTVTIPKSEREDSGEACYHVQFVTV